MDRPVVMDGKLTARTIREKLALDVQQWVAQGHPPPKLAAVLVGEDPASQVYVRNKERGCTRVGMESTVIRRHSDTTTQQLLELLRDLNQNRAVHGILVQLPLPDQVDSQQVLDAIDPIKDVDGFSPVNVGLLVQGRPRFFPCTPHGVVQILKQYDCRLAGKRVVVIGRSDIVGKPLANMLVQRDLGFGPELANATVTVCHSRSQDLPTITRTADILIAAVGRPGLVTADMVQPGAVVVDVGINRVGERLVGDVDYQAVSKVARAITPVPGGIGPLTIAMLLTNTLKACQLQNHPVPLSI